MVGQSADTFHNKTKIVKAPFARGQVYKQYQNFQVFW